MCIKISFETSSATMHLINDQNSCFLFDRNIILMGLFVDRGLWQGNDSQLLLEVRTIQLLLEVRTILVKTHISYLST